MYRIRIGSAVGALGTGTLVLQCTPSPPCPADVNGDEQVDVSDLLSVINAWGPCVDCDADITGDDVVDVNDLLTVINAWGPCAK